MATAPEVDQVAISAQTDPQTQAGGGADNRRWGPNALGRRLGRLIVVAALAWAGWTALTAWSELLSPARRSPAAAPVTPTADPAALLEADLAGGRWLLGEGGQPVAFTRLPAVDAADRVLGLSGADANAERGSGTGAELVPLIRAVAGRGVSDGPCTVYTLRRQGVVLKAVTRSTDGHETLAAARLGLRWGGGGDWMVFETAPETSGRGSVEAAGLLLTFPARSRRLAVRCDAAGRVLGEVVTVEGAAEALPSGWRRAGWSVGGLPVPGREPGPPWSCRRGDDAVQVWAFDSGGAPAPLVLFVVREPLASERSTP
jgi:hypothetical protein